MLQAHDVDTKHLVALVAVADEGSFAGAAAILGYSQAAISQQVASLERALGEPMFDRPGGPRPATLTPAGHVVLRHARLILERLDDIDNDLRHLQAGTGGRVVCGTFQSITVTFIPDLVIAMREVMPSVALQLYEQDMDEDLQGAVVAGDIDVAFMTNPTRIDHRVELIELGTDPYVVLTPAAERPKRRGMPFAIEDLADAPLIGQKESLYQAIVDDGLRALGVPPHYVFRTNDNGGVQAMVRAGLGYAVMPRLAVDARDEGIVVRPLEPALTPRTIYVGIRRGGSRLPAAERIVTMLRRIARRYLEV